VSAPICDDLTAAHTAVVTHRDLKPGNIMLTRDGRGKMLDFGLARPDQVHGADRPTMDASHLGMIMGTPGYLSPEQVRGDPPMHARTSSAAVSFCTKWPAADVPSAPAPRLR
jgi:serine/threonine protein kinase